MHARLLMPLLAVSVLAAEETDLSNREWKAKLGVFFQNTASHHAKHSRDQSIGGTTDSLAYRLTGKASTVWWQGKDRIEHGIEATYGQIKTTDQGKWHEDTDNILASMTYERTLTKPQFMYANTTGETVFTGKEPRSRPLDPIIAKLSTGYGHRYEDLLPEKDALVWRVGVYGRKRWESDAPAFQTDLMFGPEWYCAGQADPGLGWLKT